METTAPGLLRMSSRGAKAIALAFITALAVSVLGDVRGVQSVSLLAVSVVAASLAVLGVLLVRTDPMGVGITWAVVALALLACVLACMAVPWMPVNLNQTNVMGASAAVFAFLCVRGRTMTAWLAFGMVAVVFAGWAAHAGASALAGALYVAPNVAVIGMSTLFAYIMRPAAADIERLRTVAITESVSVAAVEAARRERDVRQRRLRELAGPTLRAVADGEPMSAEQADDADVLAHYLRDSIRAPSLDVADLSHAAADARRRGVTVRLLDDSGTTSIDTAWQQRFCRLAAEWVRRTATGTVTVRLNPPGRSMRGSIVVAVGGESRRVDVDERGEYTGHGDGASPSLGGL